MNTTHTDPRPLVNRNLATQNERVVWWCGFYHYRYQAEVHRVSEKNGVLCIFDMDDKRRLIYKHDVHLCNGSSPQPTMRDIALWQDMVDTYLESDD